MLKGRIELILNIPLQRTSEPPNAQRFFRKVVPYVLSFANTIYMQLMHTFDQFIIEHKLADLPYNLKRAPKLLPWQTIYKARRINKNNNCYLP